MKTEPSFAETFKQHRWDRTWYPTRDAKILASLRQTKWNIGQTARALGISRTYLYRIIRSSPRLLPQWNTHLQTHLQAQLTEQQHANGQIPKRRPGRSQH